MTSLKERDDAALLHDTADPGESFAVVYRRHASAVVRYAASRGLSADEAADVVSETFIAALDARYRYRPEGPSARSWLVGIAARKEADLHRRRARERRRQTRLEHDAVALTTRDRDTYDVLTSRISEVEAALADLPSTQQAALQARVVDDRNYAEIAHELGVSEPTARQHVSRGLAALRRSLSKEIR